MVSQDFVFLETLREIEERLGRNSIYDSLMLGGLLRKLLLDGSALVHQVNRDRKLPIRFVANTLTTFSPYNEIEYCSLEDSTDPDVAYPPLKKPVELKLEQFLKHNVMVCRGKPVTVHQLIDHVSHVEGSIHFGLAKEVLDKELQQISDSLFVGHLPAGMKVLRGIAIITLRGLATLRSNISKDFQV